MENRQTVRDDDFHPATCREYRPWIRGPGAIAWRSARDDFISCASLPFRRASGSDGHGLYLVWLGYWHRLYWHGKKQDHEQSEKNLAVLVVGRCIHPQWPDVSRGVSGHVDSNSHDPSDRPITMGFLWRISDRGSGWGPQIKMQSLPRTFFPDKVKMKWRSFPRRAVATIDY